jgi:hypothetical protein
MCVYVHAFLWRFPDRAMLNDNRVLLTNAAFPFSFRPLLLFLWFWLFEADLI